MQGTIDVWWLFDDGGLTLLLPHILSTRNKWSDCSLRIFALANRRDELEVETRSMANLLAKFRIDYSDVIIIPDAMRAFTESVKTEFNAMIDDFKTSDPIGDGKLIAGFLNIEWQGRIEKYFLGDINMDFLNLY